MEKFVPEEEFINGEYISSLLKDAENASDETINEILDRADNFQGLSHKDVAILLKNEDKKHLDRIFKIAGKIKEHIYGERIVMFAPLYLSDYCINGCTYCGFNCNHKYERRKLTQDEIREEVKVLEKMGHKRLALEAGEDPVNCPIEYILESIKTIYDMKQDGEIRRVNVNIASTTVENYRKLKEIGIGTYILFQETYCKETYEKLHLSGPKSDYWYHTTAFDRAMEGGIDDVGAGVLFGLHNDPYFEVLGLMIHNEHLEEKFGCGFHTISVPRLKPAHGVENRVFQNGVDDDTFKKIVAIIRLAVPFTGMIISTRETMEMRKELIKIGISQISGGSSVEIGGYSAREKGEPQFILADSRKNEDIIGWLIDEGVVPSFCTACYRKGRTGDRFMSLAKSGNIKNVCLPNALTTLLEYAYDYGSEEFIEKCEKLANEKVNKIENEKIRTLTTENFEKLKKGERDLYI